MNESKLLETMMFAAEAHKDQRRKGNGGSPYVNHLIEVAMLLSNIAEVQDIEVLQASILHDTLEDTHVSEDDILQKYGAKVLEYVKLVTDDKSLSLDQRRTKQIQSVEASSTEIKLIKLADHCSNIASLPSSWSKERIESYINWSFEVASKCFDASETLSQEYKKRYSLSVKSTDIESAKQCDYNARYIAPRY